MERKIFTGQLGAISAGNSDELTIDTSKAVQLDAIMVTAVNSTTEVDRRLIQLYLTSDGAYLPDKGTKICAEHICIEGERAAPHAYDLIGRLPPSNTTTVKVFVDSAVTKVDVTILGRG